MGHEFMISIRKRVLCQPYFCARNVFRILFLPWTRYGPRLIRGFSCVIVVRYKQSSFMLFLLETERLLQRKLHLRVRTRREGERREKKLTYVRTGPFTAQLLKWQLFGRENGVFAQSFLNGSRSEGKMNNTQSFTILPIQRKSKPRTRTRSFQKTSDTVFFPIFGTMSR